MTGKHHLLPLLFASLLLALPPAGSAHRLDEYLQATLVVVEPGDIRLQMNLTPGTTVAGQVLAQIDRDGDGAISAAEAAAYAESLKRDLTVEVDQHACPIKLTTSHFCTPNELRTGTGIIQLEFTVTTGPFTAGAHTLSIRNRHLPGVSVYLINAGQPTFFNSAPAGSGSVEITGQKRNENQSTGEIDFVFQPSLSPSSKP